MKKIAIPILILIFMFAFAIVSFASPRHIDEINDLPLKPDEARIQIQQFIPEHKKETDNGVVQEDISCKCADKSAVAMEKKSSNHKSEDFWTKTLTVLKYLIIFLVIVFVITAILFSILIALVVKMVFGRNKNRKKAETENAEDI